MGDRVLKVTVPPGGVEEGQKFEIPFPQQHLETMMSGVSIPVGHWRDGLCSFFRYAAFVRFGLIGRLIWVGGR